MNDIIELMKQRHSVRQYTNKRIPEDIRKLLDGYTEEMNRQGSLHMQIIYDEPECFNSRLAHYGKFSGCNNYIAVIGRNAEDLEERCGFYGEMVVLRAQELGLNTCWAKMTHGKSKAIINPDETEVIVIALGYGKTQGVPSKNKSASAVSNIREDSPAWFKRGVEAALLAPTAVNQQKFRFTLDGNNVTAKPGILGSCLKIDLGIVKCHFELAAGRENFDWKKTD